MKNEIKHQCWDQHCCANAQKYVFRKDIGKEFVYYYCVNHAYIHGFCWGCGQHEAEGNGFEFARMRLCPDCYDQMHESECNEGDE